MLGIQVRVSDMHRANPWSRGLRQTDRQMSYVAEWEYTHPLGHRWGASPYLGPMGGLRVLVESWGQSWEQQNTAPV